MARWKARGRLPISAHWTFFASFYSWGAMSKYSSKLCCLEGGGSLWAQISGGRGSSTNEFWRQKTRVPWAITWCYLRDPTFSRFDKIPACDTQTHRQTDRQTHDDGYYSRIASAAWVKIGKRAFSLAAARVWNQLPTELKLCQSTTLFKRKLKTFLLTSSYGVSENKCYALSVNL